MNTNNERHSAFENPCSQLMWNEEYHSWRLDFQKGSVQRERTIWVHAWRKTRKGNIIEIALKDYATGKNIIFEIVESDFNKEIFESMSSETEDKVMELCQPLLELRLEFNIYAMRNFLENCIKEMFRCYPFESKIKRIDVYFEDGQFFGMKWKENAQIRKIPCIGSRCCLGFPGTEKAGAN